MRLVALLSARETAPDAPERASPPEALRFGDRLLLDYQARQALLAGAEELIVHFDIPSPELTSAADRLSRTLDVPVSFLSDGPALARRLQSDDRILMLADRMIVPQDAIAELCETTAPALLVTPTTPVTAALERIDGLHVWGGAAILPAAIVLDTLDMLGDWDLMLTLLRRAVQHDARRITLSPDLVSAGHLARLEGQADADRALDRLAAGRSDGKMPRGLTAVFAPFKRLLLPELVRRGIDPSYLSIGGGALAVAGVAAASGDWWIAALLLILLAEGALALGVDGAMLMIRQPPARWLRLLVEGAGLAVLAIIGGRLADHVPLALAGIGLPLALVALLGLAGEGTRDRPDWTEWVRLTPARAVIVGLFGALAGQMVAAMLIIGLMAICAVAVRLLVVEEKRI